MSQRLFLMAGCTLLLAVSCNQTLPSSPADVTENEVKVLPSDSSIVPQATDAINQSMLTLLNQLRAGGRMCGTTYQPPVPPLKLSTQLTTAAQRHSQDMASKNFFSHTGSDGTSPFTRITQAGYRWRTAGENISAGYSTVQAAAIGWINSPGHCKNIMSASFKELGVGYAYTSTSTYKHYWTTTFAAPY